MCVLMFPFMTTPHYLNLIRKAKLNISVSVLIIQNSLVYTLCQHHQHKSVYCSWNMLCLVASLEKGRLKIFIYEILTFIVMIIALKNCVYTQYYVDIHILCRTVVFSLSVKFCMLFSVCSSLHQSCMCLQFMYEYKCIHPCNVASR